MNRKGDMPKTGCCVFENLLPGNYLVTASARNVKNYERSIVVSPQQVPVAIEAGGIGTATLKVTTFEQIAVLLVDQQNRVVAAEAYKLTAPNRKTLNSKLSGNGYVRVEKIRPGGDCEIGFPELDSDLLEFVESTAGTDTQPVAGGPAVARNTGPVPSPYTVVLGDCIASIAFKAGITPDYLWNAQPNEGLRNSRKDRCVLAPGDTVVIPPKRQNTVSKPTTFTHKFRLKGIWEYRVEILLAEIARDDITPELEGDNKRVTGNKAGTWTTYQIPPNSKSAAATVTFTRATPKRKQILPKFSYSIQVGHLRPATTPEGMEDRLRNLGYYSCWPDGVTPELKDVLRLFQLSNGIEPPDGSQSEATIDKLKELTGDPA
jgi:hypothetical protein